MTLPANIRINTSLPFPSLVKGSGPVTVAKVNGVWTVGLNFGVLGIQTPPAGNFPTDYLVVFDSIGNTFFQMPLSALASASQVPTSGSGQIVATSPQAGGFVGDGVTDNGNAGTNAWAKWTAVANTLGLGGTAANLQNSTYNSAANFGTVTIAPGAPTIVTTSNGHGLEANDCFIFSGTGGATLPNGLAFNTPYFVKGNNLTANTFQFSVINNNFQQGEGAAVGSSGSVSGTIGLVQLNADWVELLFPPGAYFQSSSINGVWWPGLHKAKLTGYGAMFPKGLSFPQNSPMNDTIFTPGGWQGFKIYAYVQTVDNSSTTITTTTVAGAAFFVVNQWIILGGIDMAGSGFPPQLREFQFMKIKDINYATGVITVQTNNTIFSNYRSSWPQFCPPTPSGTVNSGFTGGPVCIFGMPPNWDCDFVVSGIHFGFDSNFQWVNSARTVTLIDCVFDSQGLYPSVTKKFYAIRSVWFQSTEPDKIVEEAVYEDCTIAAFSLGNSSIKLLELHRCTTGGFGLGTARRHVIRDSFVGTLNIGTVYGMTDSCEITGTRCDNFGGNASTGAGRTDGGFGMGNGGTNGGFLGYYTFTNGTLALPAFLSRSNLPIQTFASFAFPGNKMFFCGSISQSNTDNMGAPFIVYDAYVDANGNYSLDTSLGSIPTGFQSSIQVTITAASPAVVNWTAHGLIAGTPLLFLSSEPTGAPHGLTYTTGGNPTVYFVSSTGLVANSFQISTQSNGGGASVITSAGTATIAAAMLTISTTGAPGTPFLVSARTISVNPVPAGSNVVVAMTAAITNSDMSVAGISDGTGNVYTFVTQTTPTAGVRTVSWYVCLNCPNAIPAGSSYNANINGNFIVHAFSGTAAVVDITQRQVQAAPATTAAISLTSGTLNHANEVLFVAWNSTLPAYGFSEQAGWTNLVPGFPLQQNASSAFKVVAATTTQVYNPTGTYILAVANPLLLSSHPCPKFTASGNSGPINLEDLNGAYEEPIFSRAKRVISGFAETSGNQYKSMYVWGNLVSLTINVVKAYTGTGTAVLTFATTGFTANLASSNMSEIIDIATVGLRTITATTATGSAGLDTIAAYAGWIASGITITPSGNWKTGSPNGTLAQQPIVEITVQTTQGVHSFDGWMLVDTQTQNISGLNTVTLSGTTRQGTESL
jgi:hypothetical protein